MSDFYCDQVLSGATPVDVFAESAEALAYWHTRPSWSVHLVVTPKVHVPSLTDLGEAEPAILLGVLQLVRATAARVEADHGAAKVVTNLGDFQESKHLHIHVLAGRRTAVRAPRRRRHPT